MPTHVLFVDDEPNVLAGLRRMLSPFRSIWEMTFATSAAEALEILQRQPQDVIVSDMRMPLMDGSQLLEEVRKLHPGTVRIVLSGHCDEETALKSVSPAHQYLAKPCDPALLRSTIDRAIALKDLLLDPRTRSVISKMDSLPSLPTLIADLLKELRQPDCSLRRVGEIISQDVAMTAQVLRIVNSAFFGLRNEVSSPEAAVVYLGQNLISSLVITSHIFRQADDAMREWLALDRLWLHGIQTATMARIIAQTETKDQKMIGDSFAAGLMHDGGRLILAVSFGDRYRMALVRARQEHRRLTEAEREDFGVTHAEVGAYLVGIWGLPHPITEALAYHHAPRNCVNQEFSPLTAVHVACVLAHERAAAQEGEIHEALDTEYLIRLGLENRLDLWRQPCEAALLEREEVA